MSASAPNDRLANLIAVLGDDETRELVRIFLGSAPRLIADIGGADLDRARRAAHTLKSSAMQMGAVDLSEHARQIEQRLHDGGPAPTAPELKLLQGQFRSTEKRLRGYAGA